MALLPNYLRGKVLNTRFKLFGQTGLVKLRKCDQAKGLSTLACVKTVKLQRDRGEKLCFYSSLAGPLTADNILRSPFADVQPPTQTLTEYIFKNIEDYADQPCITCGASGRSYDYMMMRMMVTRCAKALLTAVKLKPGEMIGLILPNIPEFVTVIHGAMEAGLVVTFANPLYTADEISRQFVNANVKAIATIELLMPVALEVKNTLKDYKGTIWVGGEHDESKGIFGLKPLLMADHEADLPEVDINNVALVPYSSGTTGLPKGVMLTHKNLVFNLTQLHTAPLMKYGENKEKITETILTVPPFFHIYGFNAILNYNLSLGNHIVSIPRFTPEDYIKCLAEYKPKTLFVVPSLLAFLATHPSVKKDHLSSIEAIMVGAAPTTENMLEKFLMKCDKTREEIKLQQGYGMTETSPVTLLTRVNYPPNKVGSVGQLIPSTEAKVISLTTNKAVGINSSGELLVRGPQVMKGYLKNEQATKETIDEDGWLHTGDVCFYDDDHFFYIVDRTKELIKVKGNQVSPTEIENIIIELPAVADAAVVGIPDHLAGELPRAFVVLKQNSKLTEKEVYDFVAKKLVKYKHLEGGVIFIPSIPRNPGGKIMRNELKVLGKKSKKY